MIYTSYFDNMYRISNLIPDIIFISIAGYAPKWFTGRYLKSLAPKKSWWKEWHDKFHLDLESSESKSFYTEKYYKTVLDKLNPETLWDDLSRYKDVCMLCYELPQKFCHRHIVSSWFRSFNFFVDEF